MDERIPISENDRGYDGLWQTWYGENLTSYQSEVKKDGSWGKRNYGVSIPYSFINPCNGCKKQASYGVHFYMDKNTFCARLNLCKSCNMKFINMNKQIYILDDCNTLIKQIFKEITNANRNRRTTKTISMQHDFRD